VGICAQALRSGELGHRWVGQRRRGRPTAWGRRVLAVDVRLAAQD
jgi:hypothetical protein